MTPRHLYTTTVPEQPGTQERIEKSLARIGEGVGKREEPVGLEMFREQYGDAVADDWISNICECFYSGERKNYGVTIACTIRHDAINATFTGFFFHDGKEWFFRINDGNWGGTEIVEFGEDIEELYPEPPAPTRWTFLPTRHNLKEDNPAMWGVYLEWRKQPWFAEELRKYAYDRHFEPTDKIERHYRDFAARKGLRISTEEEFDELLKR